ncbi:MULTISPECIES: flagellar basal body rod protein FlgB [Pseudovibrio]|uniref:flagellar basal body rod protein FlgB n=1 Tax=Stappiaceae TaxID=2821832 RepID=UPI0023652823|nr:MULTISPECIES: flagellar basal body rod protein FlgB [Pseudovibrio]MDD7909020.1 flagellar basal body rod protein FlgB [Pseudovibrio exalbescens]MDX5593659.1 flagellar basal body rod protein FlgB [Pseudovibrio sp. SPO723]
MEPVYLFDLASRQSTWLSVRQATIAENVSQSDTPGYAAKEVEPFRDVLDKTQLGMAATSAGHIGGDFRNARDIGTEEAEPWQVSASKNSVSLEQEMIKSGEVARAHQLNTAVVQKFHGLMLASLGKR